MVRNGPWPLTHVCSHWRETAILLPSLWSSLIIRTRLCDINDPEALLQTVLQRSKRSPLSLRLRVQSVPSFLDTPMWQRIFFVLAAHSTAWKDVEFEMSSHECYNEVMGMFSDSPIPIQLPLLETLQIILGTPGGSEIDEHSISTFTNAPMLRSVILKPYLPINLPWSQITYLCTPELSLQQLLDTLRVAVRLETLSMSLDVYIDPQRDIPVPVTNIALETLKTWDVEYLSYLTLPSLTSLRIDGNDLVEVDHTGWHMGVRDWDMVSFFVSRSGCHLKSLRICVEKATDTLLAMLRIATTDVTDMTFVNEPGSISQASLLPVLQKDPLLLPKLEVLSFNGSESQDSFDVSEDYCRLDEVLEFVQSCYRNGTRPLKSLHIDCEVLYPEENEICVDDKDRRFYLDQLKVFVDDGLDLVINL
ncbi:uncharacterized protein ARMOST_13786 [Armillaria ostoyae]|uniref:F-box domain-containing protein n=1 Tax=Armillaria ostoyae TaxID=47428 RepID=A0A284RNR9_ARMOS|nr:uncharacterized protein ARMOST_13786 [Armillaria ostoyae]